MRTMLNKLMACVLCAVLLMGMLPTALAEDTVLQVGFSGLTAHADGQWHTTALSGAFEVYQDGALLGQIEIDGAQNGSITLPGGSSVVLKPVMSAMPQGYLVHESGYNVTITQGRVNMAPVTVYADAGLFSLQAEGACTFTITSADDSLNETIVTDAQGAYLSPVALLSGVYTVQPVDAPRWPAFTLTIAAYTGNAEQITAVDLAYAQANAVAVEVTAEPTAAPTAEPTVTPTEAPTPEPTAAPTAEPTVAPTEAPTEAPTPEPTAVPTAEPTVAPTEAPTEIPTAEPTAVPVLEPTAVPAGDPGTVQVHVFLDGNNNGLGGKYENGVEGVTVGLVSTGDVFGAMAVSAVTNKNGDATFTGVAPGQYMLRAQLPAGHGFAKFGKLNSLTGNIMQESQQQTQDSAPFEVAPGAEVLCGVGAAPMASVSGYVWLDVNADGVRQDDEPGQAGCVIELVLRGGDTMYELVTGEDGNYIFPSVKPGEYNIRATTPDGLMFTKYTKYGGDKRSILTTEGVRRATKLVYLKSDTRMEEQNIGLVTQSVLEVQCFLDANFNGRFDAGEQPLAGVEAELIKQGTGKTVVTKESGEDGVITFDALRANTYRLRALLPVGAAFTAVTDDPSGNQFKAREGRRENYVDDVVVETGMTHQMVVGGVWPATVTGTCYMDDNFSATMDGGEKAVSGLTVILLDASGNEIARDKTSNKGKYVFENVNPGSYTITLSAKKGYAFTKLGEGNIIVNTGDGTGKSNPFDVSLGATVENLDIGMILPGTVQGQVFADANDNGLQDAGEIGLTGTVVRLMGEEGEWFSAAIGEDGAFCFDAVMPGRYYLQYELPQRGAFAQIVGGGNTIAGENGVGAGQWFDFAVGSTVNAPLCGGLILGQVDGIAFHDSNASGAMDAGEATLSGVTITLTPARSDLSELSVTTGVDGAFVLSGIHPDTYTMTLTYPDGMIMSRMGDVTLPVSAGAAAQTVELPVAMGDLWSAQQLGGVIPATVDGQLWLDENNDGLWGEGEATPAGETVELIDQLTGEAAFILTTDAAGIFRSEAVIPGDYIVRYPLDSDTVGAKSGDSTFSQAEGALESAIQVGEGESADGLVLGVMRYTNLGGQVWVDMGGSVNPLSGAQVTLTDANGNTLNTVTTAEDGLYRFGQLLPGMYAVSVALPEGQVVVEPDDERLTSGAQVSIITLCSGRTGTSAPVEIKMGQDQLELNIGSVLPGRLGDMAWLDLNRNGLIDSGEGGVPGVTVELVRGGSVVASTVTDQYGYYIFSEVYPAAYTLRATAPAEVKPTQQRTDFPGIVSVLPETDAATVESAIVSVASDRSNYNADLGYVLRSDGAYPDGYGQGATQDWTKITVGE